MLLLAALATAGCDQVITTAQLPAIREDGILGRWKPVGVPGHPAGPDPMLIQFKDGAYRIGTPEDFSTGQESSFTLARVGKFMIAQFPTDCPSYEPELDKNQSCWSLDAPELSGDLINWYDFDPVRLGRESLDGGVDLPHSVLRRRKGDGTIDNTILLLADAGALRRFLDSYVGKRQAFVLTGRLQRIP